MHLRPNQGGSGRHACSSSAQLVIAGLQSCATQRKVLAISEMELTLVLYVFKSQDVTYQRLPLKLKLNHAAVGH